MYSKNEALTPAASENELAARAREYENGTWQGHLGTVHIDDPLTYAKIAKALPAEH